MRELIDEILSLLNIGAYKNEESIRFSIISPILKSLGWNTNDPREVAVEISPSNSEDKGKIDIALFINGELYIIIEIKRLGVITSTYLPKCESQIKDYNKDLTAKICILTDGESWRFYLSRASGSFSDKMFKHIKLNKNNIDEFINTLEKYLSKKSLENKSTIDDAENCLINNKKEIHLRDCLEEAQIRVLRTGNLTLTQAFQEISQEKGKEVPSDKEIEKFISKNISSSIPSLEKEPKDLFNTSGINLISNSDFTNTSVEANIDGQQHRGWNPILKNTLIMLLKKGKTIDEINKASPHVVLRSRKCNYKSDSERYDIKDYGCSWVGYDANKSFQSLKGISKGFKLRINLEITYKDNSKHTIQL